MSTVLLHQRADSSSSGDDTTSADWGSGVSQLLAVQNQRQRQEMQAVDGERDALQATSTALQQELHAARSALVQSTAAQSVSVASATRLGRLVEEAHAQVAEQARQARTSATEAAHWKRLYEEAQSALLQERSVSLREGQRAEAAEGSLAEARMQCRLAQEDSKQLRAQIDSMQHSNAALQSSLQTLLSAAQTEVAHATSRCDRLVEEAQSMKQQRETLQAQLVAQIEARRKVEEEGQALCQQLSATAAERDSALQAVERGEARALQLAVHVKEGKEEIQALHGDVRSLQMGMDAAVQQVATATSQASAEREKCASLKTSLSLAQALAAARAAELKAMEDTHRKERTAMGAEAERRQRECSSAQRDIEQLKQRIAQLEGAAAAAAAAAAAVVTAAAVAPAPAGPEFSPACTLRSSTSSAAATVAGHPDPGLAGESGLYIQWSAIRRPAGRDENSPPVGHDSLYNSASSSSHAHAAHRGPVPMDTGACSTPATASGAPASGYALCVRARLAHAPHAQEGEAGVHERRVSGSQGPLSLSEEHGALQLDELVQEEEEEGHEARRVHRDGGAGDGSSRKRARGGSAGRSRRVTFAGDFPGLPLPKPEAEAACDVPTGRTQTLADSAMTDITSPGAGSGTVQGWAGNLKRRQTEPAPAAAPARARGGPGLQPLPASYLNTSAIMEGVLGPALGTAREGWEAKAAYGRKRRGTGTRGGRGRGGATR